jgi:hypothetical protein
MKLWPSPEDHTPHETRFWVRSVNGGIVPTEVVVETPEAVERRLEADFLLYKVMNLGRGSLVNVVGREDDEV